MPETIDDLRNDLQTTLGAAYALERELVGGGMSRVFVAQETALRRRVVVKVLPPELVARISLERFRREIEFAASLQHPHIVTLLAASATGALLYYMMPFVDGQSLRERLVASSGRLSVVEAIRIAIEVAGALQSAHEQGIVHRDIKPGNILISAGHAVVTDFGVARAVSRAARPASGTGASAVDSTTASTLTTPGWLVGTPAYMSPEQAVGAANVDGRSDVYAVGCVLYEMLTGSPPFVGSRDEVVAGRLAEIPPARPSRARADVPPALDRVVLKALARHPEGRYATADEFRHALLAIDARAVSRRTAWRAAATVVSLAAAIVLAVVLYWRAVVRPSTLDSDRIAVAPFYVLTREPELARWSEGIADVLSNNIDGMGPLRTASLSSFIRRWTDRTDPGSAGELARITGARFIIFGSLIPAAERSVRLTATVYDAAEGRRLGNEIAIDAAEPATRMAAVSDSLTMAVLNVLGSRRVIGAARRPLLGSSVPPNALKAFVDGERFFRHAAWDSALVSYERAVAEDSTFAVALSRIGLVLSWQRVASDSLARAFALRAGALNHGLGSRDSLLVLADSISASIDDSLPDAVWWARAKRLVSTLAVAVKRYSSDPIAWYALGDARMHFGGPVGVTERETLAAFDSAIAIDSAFSPAYVHPVELALEMDGTAAARRYVDAYLAQGPTDNSAGGARVLSALITGDGIRSSETRRLLDTASADALFAAWIPLRRWTDSAEVAVQILRMLYAGKRASSYGLFADTASLRLRLASQLAFRGHLREAYSLAGSEDPRLFAELAEFGAVPDSVVRRTFARWLQDGRVEAVQALRWWAQHGDTAAIREFVRREQVSDQASTAADRVRSRRAMEAIGRAYLAIARHDTAAALSLFASVPDSTCIDCYLARLSEAEVGVSRDKRMVAADGLTRWFTFPARTYPSEVVWWVVRASNAVGTGARGPAVERMCAALAVWAGGDAGFAAPFAEARDLTKCLTSRDARRIDPRSPAGHDIRSSPRPADAMRGTPPERVQRGEKR